MSSHNGIDSYPTGNEPTLVAQVLEFLDEIGLSWRRGDPSSGFISHILIEQGVLVINDQTCVLDILHEAGHLAVTRSDLRQHANGDLAELEEACVAAMEATPLDDWLADDPRAKALMQSGETEATAWSWAAGKHLNLPEALIIENHQYDGQGDAIRLMLSFGQYLGVNGLVAGNMLSKTSQYPRLKRWTQI